MDGGDDVNSPPSPSPPSPQPPVPPVYILNTDETYVRRFRMCGTRTSFRFNPVPEGVSELDWIREGFSSLVDLMRGEAADTDQLGFTLQSMNLKNRDPGYVAFRPASEVDGDILWQIFGGIIQSNAESVKSTDTFRISCTRVNLPVGSARNRVNFYNNFNEECSGRKGIVVIRNNDNLCLARALVVGRAHAKGSPLYKKMCANKGNRQTLKANKLLAKARVEIPEEGAGIPEIRRLQEHLKKYKITVYMYNRSGRDVYFEGPDTRMKINLLFHNGHFNVITNLTSAFATSYYCEPCHVPYERKGEHRCQNICPACQTVSPPCKTEHGGITCSQCNRKFRNQECYVHHQGGLCRTVKLCKECGKTILLSKRKSVHVCGEAYCKPCDAFKMPDHKCFMRIDTGHPKNKDFLFVFFDLETRQDEEEGEAVLDGIKTHRVNLCVSQQFCWLCIGGGQCDTCNNRTRVFREDTIRRFMDYVMDIRKSFKNVCVIAHNGQGFDFQFVLKYVLEETRFSPELIMRGTKVVLMELANVRFIDSLNYFPMALAALPKAFELPPEKKKGYFPHLFNTVANQSYVGPIPPREYYCPENMFEKGSRDFENWYAEQVSQGYVFDFQKELVEYCISDVDILAQACIRFRALFLQECNVDPFLEAVTIASACNKAFRRNFLKPNTISLVPNRGYRMVDNQSAIALKWLSWEEERRGVRIQHAGRGRETKIAGIKVDGFDGERVYEFQGCYYHGCPKCFPYGREELLKDDDPSDTLQHRFERTKAKVEKLSTCTTYELVEMWECEFNKLKKRQNLTHLDSLPILNTLPLNPRDAFFGGRTGNAKTYHKVEEGETIQYVDVCSLYPYVCKYGKYPVGHPTLYVGDRDCRQRGLNAEGLLKCKILPPRDLYHPVLPTRMHGKLMFVLCRTCGQALDEGDCQHDSQERVLVGTWTMDEIRKAVDKGYVILDMYELWEYEVASVANGNGLFTTFIDKFLKVKQEASGYPSWCVTDADRIRYVNDYFEHEGIRLEPDRIQKNGGLRSLAKLMLNSFWGKFGQRENQTKAMVVRDPKTLFGLLTDPCVQVNVIQEVNQDTVLVNWQLIEEVGESLSTVNVVLAAYTTAQARLKLYEHLELLGGQVLYYDTDSVLYVSRGDLYRVPTGDHLGEMTDELLEYGQGSYIVEFVSGGPKTYAYLVYSTNTDGIVEVCKIKGLTLNLRTSRRLNFEKLKEMVLGTRDGSNTVQLLEIEENRIRRTKKRDVVTVSETKIFKVTGAKRRRHNDHDTLPYGYTDRQIDIVPHT